MKAKEVKKQACKHECIYLHTDEFYTGEIVDGVLKVSHDSQEITSIRCRDCNKEFNVSDFEIEW